MITPSFTGEPPKCGRWTIQCVIYSIVMVVEKSIIYALMTLNIWDTVSHLNIHVVTYSNAASKTNDSVGITDYNHHW